MPMTLNSILNRKGYHVVTVAPGDPLRDVVDTLVAGQIGAVVVTGPGDAVLGLVSERDIVRGLSRDHDQVNSLTAGDVMARDVPTLSPEAGSIEALQLMTLSRNRHIPVQEGDALVGLVSIGDLVKARLDEAELDVNEMRAYIAQTDPRPDQADQYAVR